MIRASQRHAHELYGLFTLHLLCWSKKFLDPLEFDQPLVFPRVWRATRLAEATGVKGRTYAKEPGNEATKLQSIAPSQLPP